MKKVPDLVALKREELCLNNKKERTPGEQKRLNKIRSELVRFSNSNPGNNSKKKSR